MVMQNGFVWLVQGGWVLVQYFGDQFVIDLVVVVLMLIGMFYLWGGNSCWGIDCLGLVQVGLLVCGVVCFGDSDMQQVVFVVVQDICCNDLLFWFGYVVIVLDDIWMIYVIVFIMSVVIEFI